MKSDKAKVLHELFHAPMLHHVLQIVKTLNPQQTIVIIGHQRQSVIDSLTGFPVEFAVQEEQLGTGHAVLCSEEHLCNESDTVMILCGDTPLIRSDQLHKMIQQHHQNSSTLTVMTTILEESTNYGRIICDDFGKIQSIVEEKDATEDQKEIKEINAGIYCVQKEFLFDALKRVGTDNNQGEIYLTDILSIAVSDSLPVNKFFNPSSLDILGVNSRVEMAKAHKELQLRRNRELMLQGVSMIDPESISIDVHATVGNDTIVHPGVLITGKTEIGASCLLENGVILNNCTVGNHIQIGAYSYLDGVTIADDTLIEPFTLNKTNLT